MIKELFWGERKKNSHAQPPPFERERETLILPGLSRYLKQGRWSSAAETGAPPQGGGVGGPQVSPTGHGGKLNPTSVSWLGPEVSSPPALPGGTSGRERPVCRGGVDGHFFCFSARKTHLDWAAFRPHCHRCQRAGGRGGQTMARQTWPKLKALFGHGSCRIPFWSAGVDNERSRQKTQTNTRSTGPVLGQKGISDILRVLLAKVFEIESTHGKDPATPFSVALQCENTM